MTAVHLQAVHKSYGTNPVVRGLNLELEAGQMLALLGPSGCGKTTTLRMLAGLERADRGTIRLGDEVVDAPGTFVQPERRGLGMVFQSYAVWPHKRVAENVAYPLQLRGTAKAEIAAKVRQALGWVRLEALGERLPHQLSGGQLQRVALARALVAGPKVLLLDEPLSNLDAALRDELRAEIAALRSRLGTTMVYVTHDQGEALALADRVAVMSGGVIEQLDAPERLYAEPKTAFVAGFVGGANLLQGTAVEGWFVTGGVRLELPEALRQAQGPGILAVRPEDVGLETDRGTPLPLTARLFLGSAIEFRLTLGDTLLRAIGPSRAVLPGQSIGLTVLRARFFPGVAKS